MLDALKKVIDENNIEYIIQTDEFAMIEDCLLENYATGCQSEEETLDDIKYFPAEQLKYLLLSLVGEIDVKTTEEWRLTFIANGNWQLTKRQYELEVMDRTDFFKEQKYGN